MAAFLRRAGGSMLEICTGSHGRGVERRVPEMRRMVEFNCTSTWLVWASTHWYKVDRISSKVDRISNKVYRDKLSNSSCCRFVAKIGNKVERIGNKVERIRKQSISVVDSLPVSTKSTVMNSTLSPVCTGLKTHDVIVTFGRLAVIDFDGCYCLLIYCVVRFCILVHFRCEFY